MEINQASRLMQLNALNNMIGTNNSAASSTADSPFSALLQGMINNSTSQGTTNAQTVDSASKQVNATSSLNNLSIQPEKLMQMLQMMALSSMNSSTQDAGIGTVSDDGSSDNSSYGLGDISGSSSDMTQMLETMLETMMSNQNANSTSTAAAAANNSNASVSQSSSINNA